MDEQTQAVEADGSEPACQWLRVQSLSGGAWHQCQRCKRKAQEVLADPASTQRCREGALKLKPGKQVDRMERGGTMRG